MCGIVALLRRDGAPVDVSPLDGMLDVIRYRGPDDRGTWTQGACALGQVRLGILDPSVRARQPMVTSDGLGVLVYNGEVYNFADLRRELEAEGVVLRSHGDTEVVLHALHRWGPRQAVPRFDGMFALAYRDLRDDSLWLARDRLGIKPLVVAEPDGLLLVASEIKALLVHPALTPRADRSRIAYYLLYGRTSGREAFLEGLRSIEPGTLHHVQGGATEVTRYFHVPEAVDVERILAARGSSPEDAVRATGEALTRSVRMHLVSDAPLAALCSGGVDSSLTAALAKDVRPDLEAYVADVRGDVGELAQAMRVAKHLDLRLHPVPVDRETFLRLWPAAVWHDEVPSVHESDVALLAVVRACKADGVKVLITGEGADELFGGYAHYVMTWTLWRKARRRARLPWPFRVPWSRRWKHWQTLPHAGVRFRKDGAMRRRLMAAIGSETEHRRWVLAEHLARIEPPEDRAALVHQLDDLSFHLGWILQRHDRIAMAASIEARVPFLENDVIDLALHLPPPLKVRGRTTKWVLKRFAEERLPRDIVHAPKKGFPVPEHHWRGSLCLIANGGVLPDLLHWSRGETARIVDEVDGDWGLRYQLTSLEIWARLFVREEGADEIAERLLRG